MTITSHVIEGGSILLDGRSYYALAANGTYLPSKFNVFPDNNLAENLLLSVTATIPFLSSANVVSQQVLGIRWAVSAFQLDTTSKLYHQCQESHCHQFRVLPRLPAVNLLWTTSLYETISELVPVPVNPNVPGNITYFISNSTTGGFQLKSFRNVVINGSSYASAFMLSGQFNISGIFNFGVSGIDHYSSEEKLVAIITLNVRNCPSNPSTTLSRACNSKGYCVDEGQPFGSKYTCQCLELYSGSYCQTYSPPTQSVSDSTLTAGISAGIGVACVAVVVAVIWISRRAIFRHKSTERSMEKLLLDREEEGKNND